MPVNKEVNSEKWCSFILANKIIQIAEKYCDLSFIIFIVINLKNELGVL